MRIVLALSLVAAALAGCVAAPDLGASTIPGAAALPPLPADAAPFSHLLCAGDALLPLDGPRDAACNFKVTTESGPATEVHVAVNPTNPMNLVGGSKDFTLGKDARCGKFNVWSGYYWSKDGGRSWGQGLLPGHPKDERKTALSDYACGSDPVIVFAPDGTAYYVSIHYTDDPSGAPPVPQLGPVWGYGTLNSALAITASRDGGESWEDPVIVRSLDDGSLIDKEWAAVDMRDGTIYITYILNGVLQVQRSDDGGATWTDAVPIVASSDFPGTDRMMIQFGQVGVDADGRVHFTYWAVRESDGLTGVYHKSSEDRGATWSKAHEVAHFFPVFDLEFTHKYRIVPNPAFAVDTATGALYVTFAERAAPHQADVEAALNVFVTASKDGGQSWTTPVRVHDDGLGPGVATNGQWMSAIAVGPDSTVHVTWLDYRDDPAGQFARVHYAHSTDGGASWSKNAALSDVPFDGTGGYHQSGAGTIGDYMGLAASPLGVTAFWADTREERNDVFAAVLPAR